MGKSISGVDPEETILDLSVRQRIPHMQECGGNGRCTTCRVRILEGMNNVTPRTAAERRVARRRNWGASMRLACQTKVKGRVTLERMIRTSSEVSRLQLEKIAAGVAEERHLAILFCDMRNFTPFAERHLPYDVVHVLNRFFGVLGEPILMNDGVIYQYVGDEITGLFGLQTKDPEKACRAALRAALGMVSSLGALNKTLEEEFGVSLDVGIGLHYGPAVVGLLGHPSHRQFGVIGDAVNVASRIQARNRELGTKLLASQTLLQQLPPSALTTGRRDRSPLKGKEEVLEIVEVQGFSAPDDLQLVQSSLGVLLSEEASFSRAFYQRLFEVAPAARQLFEATDMKVQGQLMTHMLKHAVYALSRPEDIQLGLREMGRRHHRYGVRPEHYPVVREVLIHTLEAALGEDWTAPVARAWTNIVQMVTDLMEEGAG